MGTPALSKPAKDKTCSQILSLLLALSLANGSPHIPKQLTWQVLSQTGEVIWSTTGLHAPNTWWPTLTPDFCQLAAGLEEWDIPTENGLNLKPYTGPRPQQMTAPGCSSPTARCKLAQSDFYVCPRDDRDQATAYRCGGYQEYFCSQWGCETTGDAYWIPSSTWDSISVHRNYTRPDADGHTCYHAGGWKGQAAALSLPLNITFTPRGQSPQVSWTEGRTWGLRWYLSGKDKGVTFKIKLKVENPPTRSVGPNRILSDQRTPARKLPKPIITDVPASSSSPGTGDKLL